jgi:hypothetical protein
MLPVTVRRVLLAEHRVDFRKGLDGLLAEAYRIGAKPYDGDCVVFVRKDRTQLRALVGDGLGLYLTSRRFEGGRLSLLLQFCEDPRTHAITTGELSLLLEGASFTVHQRARAWREVKAKRSSLAESALAASRLPAGATGRAGRGTAVP